MNEYRRAQVRVLVQRLEEDENAFDSHRTRDPILAYRNALAAGDTDTDTKTVVEA